MTMRFSLTPYTDSSYDPIELTDAQLSFPHGARRAQRVALIDGTSYFHDEGFSDTDREATVVGRVTMSQAQALDAMFRAGVTVYFDDDIGVFTATFRSLSIANGWATIGLFITSRLMSLSDIVYPPVVPPTPSEEWIDVTSDTYWRSSNNTSSNFMLTWDGSKWAGSSGGGGYLYQYLCTLTEQYGTIWGTDFIPKKIRLTVSQTISGITFDTLYVFTDNSQILFSLSSFPVSLYEYDLDYPILDGSNMLSKIMFYWHRNLVSPFSINIEISKIEVYGLKTW